MRDRNFSICHSIAARNRRILSQQQFSGLPSCEISAFPVLLLHVAAFSRRGKRMMLITELFPFFLIQFLLPKSPLRYPSPLNSLSVEQKSLFMFPKILRLFQFRRALRPSFAPSLPVVVFPLKLFLRPKAAQFSWVLFIPRDKGGEERERKK